MASSDIIQCIYCKKSKPSSKEHAVQRSIGGNITIPDVCQDCNNGFSGIDQTLSDKSLIAIMRIGKQKSTSKKPITLGGQSFSIGDDGEAYETVLKEGFAATLKPSLLFKVEGETYEIGLGISTIDDFAKLIKTIKKYILTKKLEKVPTLFPPSSVEKFTKPRVSLHRGNELVFKYPLNYEDKESVHKKILKILEQHIDSFESEIMEKAKGAKPQKSKDPTVHINQSFNINELFRAVSKMAFNCLCDLKGADFVLKSEFDPIRDYIKGENVVLTDKDGKRVEADTRFCNFLPQGHGIPLDQLGEEDRHTIILFYHAPYLSAIVSLFGHGNFVVNLAELNLSEKLQAFYLFDYNKRTNQKMMLEDWVSDMVSKLN